MSFSESWAGSRCMHSTLLWVLILVMYIGKPPAILFKITHNIAAQGNRPNEQL
jgi:hypothetical protein